MPEATRNRERKDGVGSSALADELEKYRATNPAPTANLASAKRAILAGR